jgi:hypothetical protein
MDNPPSVWLAPKYHRGAQLLRGRLGLKTQARTNDFLLYEISKVSSNHFGYFLPGAIAIGIFRADPS